MNLTEIDNQLREEVHKVMEKRVMDAVSEMEARGEMTPGEKSRVAIMRALGAYMRSKADEETTVRMMAEESGLDIPAARRYLERFWQEGVKYWIREIAKWRQVPAAG